MIFLLYKMSVGLSFVFLLKSNEVIQICFIFSYFFVVSKIYVCNILIKKHFLIFIFCSVLEFFEKLSKWVEMVGSPRRLQEQVSRIQSCLAVSAVVYKKFLPIFRKLFAAPGAQDEEKKKKCKKVFELLWTLFIALKSMRLVTYFLK